MNSELKDYIIRLTGKQKALLLLACDKPVSSTYKDVQESIGVDQFALSGIIGTLLRDKYNDTSILRLFNRDDKGQNLYVVNEDVVTKYELKDFLVYLGNVSKLS